MFDEQLTCYTCQKPFDYGERVYISANGLRCFCYSCVEKAQRAAQDLTVDKFAELIGLGVEVNK